MPAEVGGTVVARKEGGLSGAALGGALYAQPSIQRKGGGLGENGGRPGPARARGPRPVQSGNCAAQEPTQNREFRGQEGVTARIFGADADAVQKDEENVRRRLTPPEGDPP